MISNCITIEKYLFCLLTTCASHTARKIKIRKGLTEIQTYDKETASFEVELSHGNVDGVWQKDGHILKNNNRLRMTAKGRVHSLTISNLTLDDTGTYIFSVENIKSLARLEVKGIVKNYFYSRNIKGQFTPKGKLSLYLHYLPGVVLMLYAHKRRNVLKCLHLHTVMAVKSN